jgi:UDP-N-acetylmuramate dehydrogenase
MKIQENISLRPYNTFAIEARARYFADVHSAEQLQELIRQEVYQQQDVFILGGGSNVLLTRDFDGLVVKIGISGIEIIEENDEEALVKAGAGENWHQFVLHCIGQGLGGIENLSLIPGTVGAAPMQNIGAYGVEIKDVFERLQAVDLRTGHLQTFSHEDCRFGYRESIFKNELKGKFIITSVTLRLSKKPVINTTYGTIESTLAEMRSRKGYVPRPAIEEVSDAVIAIRQSKLPDPKVIGNAGSFFKNPVVSRRKYEALREQYENVPGYPLDDQHIKVPAGWLIEQCGWKGKRFGGTGVHDKQALVLVNHGQAVGREIWELALKIKQSVLEKFGIDISPEVNIV